MMMLLLQCLIMCCVVVCILQKSPPKMWDKLVERADLLSEPWLFHPDPKKSLIQLFNILHKHIDDTFSQLMVSGSVHSHTV